MIYEFWDMRTSNLMDAFDSEKDALLALLQVAEEQGDRAAEFLMLIEDDSDADASRVIAIGWELLDLARSAA